MYNTTYAYRRAVRALARTDRITGTVTLKDGTQAPLSDKKIGPGGLSVKRSCVTGEELEFGGAILSTLTAEFRTDRPRNAFYGATIEPIYGIQLADGRWFDLPLGTFQVAEAGRSGKTVSVTAYDSLTKLDKQYFGQNLVGTAYQILTRVCSICDIPLGMTEADLYAFPNSAESLQINSTSGCKTYRDCVRQVAVVLAAFASADVNGSLILKSFSKTVDVSLGKRNRYNIKPADYICQYERLIVESSNEAVYSSTIDGGTAILAEAVLGEMILGYDGDSSDGLEMVISGAACWNSGTVEALQARCDAIMEELFVLEYTPAVWTMPGDPSLEPGDRVRHVTDEGDFDSLITSVTWRFRGKMQAESVGRNPSLMHRQTVSTDLPLKDYNGDGKITLEDADCFMQMLADDDLSLTLEDDWNGDGQLDVGDVVAYRRMVINLLGSVPNTTKAVEGEVIVAKEVENGVVKETATIPIAFGYRGECADADSTALSGQYKLTEATINCPVTDGLLIVFGDGNVNGPTVQLAVSSDGQQRKLRTLWYGTAYNWTDL